MSLAVSIAFYRCGAMIQLLTLNPGGGMAHHSFNQDIPLFRDHQQTSKGLLNQRMDIGAQLLTKVQSEVVKIGVNIQAVEVKDVMFAADVRRSFADVLKAKQEGQVALERTRGESAALRNLANAARVLEGNAALMNPRLMQSLSACPAASCP